MVVIRRMEDHKLVSFVNGVAVTRSYDREVTPTWFGRSTCYGSSFDVYLFKYRWDTSLMYCD